MCHRPPSVAGGYEHFNHCPQVPNQIQHYDLRHWLSLAFLINHEHLRSWYTHISGIVVKHIHQRNIPIICSSSYAQCRSERSQFVSLTTKGISIDTPHWVSYRFGHRKSVLSDNSKPSTGNQKLQLRQRI